MRPYFKEIKNPVQLGKDHCASEWSWKKIEMKFRRSQCGEKQCLCPRGWRVMGEVGSCGQRDLGHFLSPSTKEEEVCLGSGSSFCSPSRSETLWKLKKRNGGQKTSRQCR